MVRMYLLLMSKAKKSLVETVSFDPSGWGRFKKSKKMHHFIYLDDLKHSSNSCKCEEDVRWEVLMSVLHH